MKAIRCFVAYAFLGTIWFLAPLAQAATITISPTDLKGVPRLNGRAIILVAANENNQSVNAKEIIKRRETGEIDITIDDPNVRAVTILIEAGGALSSTLQNVLVINQTTFVALPNLEQMQCPVYDCRPSCRFGKLFHR